MDKRIKKNRIYAAIAAVLFAGSAFAQMPPPGPPPLEALATVPGLTAAQQSDVRKLMIQRRDAQEAAHNKARTEMETVRTRERSEHERIDEQYSEQLRKALGDDGYRQFAQWELAHRGPPERDGHGPGRHGGPDRHGPEAPPDGPNGAPPRAPGQ